MRKKTLDIKPQLMSEAVRLQFEKELLGICSRAGRQKEVLEILDRLGIKYTYGNNK